MDREHRVAIVGSQSFLGRGLSRRLAARDDVARVLCVDLRPPEEVLPKRIFHRADLTRPAADRELGDLFADERIDTVVHLAMLDSPMANLSYAHELDVIGTLRLCTALRSAGVSRLLFRSTTLVYGPRPQNPAELPESWPLPSVDDDAPFLRDKRAAEEQARRFAAEVSGAEVAILRFAPTVGPDVSNWLQSYLCLPLAPFVAGVDPLLQVIHQSDALDALDFAFREGLQGVWNVGAPQAVPLTGALRLAGSRPFPVALPLARAAAEGLRSLGFVPALSPALLDLLRYPFVADTRKLREAGFTARLTTGEAVRRIREGGEA